MVGKDTPIGFQVNPAQSGIRFSDSGGDAQRVAGVSQPAFQLVGELLWCIEDGFRRDLSFRLEALTVVETVAGPDAAGQNPSG